ncbi:MAG: nitroreductase [Burkholderiaceae bacterium]|nr:nitroreductase [Microbacteriaceae bacterium]
MREAAVRRRSHPRVTGDAPSREELLHLIEAASGVADHGALRPWRLVELRGEARQRLGDSLVAASAARGITNSHLATKPSRAELLLAIVSVTKPSLKVPAWEQDATAAGVAHVLSLLLDEAGWGVMWRSGPFVDASEVRELHGLRENERLLGWLYVGGVPDGTRDGPKLPVDPGAFLTAL